MRILPPAQREAMFEIYSFCRAVDDIADDPGPRQPRRGQLQAWRANIDAIYSSAPPASLAGLAAAVKAFALKREDFIAVIDGMEMDVDADIRAPDWTTLYLYCDRVACAVGRLSVRVFGMEEQSGLALAHELGCALQLTNILRDLDEDAAVGRLYLPREALTRAGINSNDPKTALRSPTLGQACAELVARAREHFAQADQIMAALPRRRVRAPRIMGLVYRSMLDQLEARGWSAPRQAIRVSRVRLLWIVLRHALV